MKFLGRLLAALGAISMFAGIVGLVLIFVYIGKFDMNVITESWKNLFSRDTTLITKFVFAYGWDTDPFQTVAALLMTNHARLFAGGLLLAVVGAIFK